MATCLPFCIRRKFSLLLKQEDSVQWCFLHFRSKISSMTATNDVSILGSWFRASYSKYVYEHPTRSNDNILVLLQDLYMFRVPAVPIIRSTILQLTATGMTYITLDREMYGKICFIQGPTRCTCIFYFLYRYLYVFRVLFSPIIRSTIAMRVFMVLVSYSIGAGTGWDTGHPHTFSTVSYRLSESVPDRAKIVRVSRVPNSICSNGITHPNHTHKYGCTLQLCS
jgi:hypothetical protein